MKTFLKAFLGFMSSLLVIFIDDCKRGIASEICRNEMRVKFTCNSHDFAV